MDIDKQIISYFAAKNDATGLGEAAPLPTKGNTVTHFIDGRSYFGEIRKLLKRLGKGQNKSKQFFYMIGWRNHLSPIVGNITAGNLPGTAGGSSLAEHELKIMPAFRLEDNGYAPYPVMADVLAQKAAAGVDVRVMSWVNTALLIKEISDREPNWSAVVVENLLGIDHLRNLTVKGKKPLAKNICALSIGNMLGAMHLKMIVAYDGNEYFAYTGGIDLVPNRVAKRKHPILTTTRNSTYKPKKPWFEKKIEGTNNWKYQELWHDMAVGVKGPAVQSFYDFFKDLWNEQLKRKDSLTAIPGRQQIVYLSKRFIRSVEPGTKAVPQLTLKIPSTGKHRVQVARTLPQFNFGNLLGWLKVVSKPLSFAPKGKFEITVIRRKAIANAKKYIYIEDPSFWSQEIMIWIRNRVQNNSEVRVILLASAQGDPGDPPAKGERVEAMNKYLIAGLNQQEKARIGFYSVKPGDYYVHSKVTIIDDYWLFVGSANCTRRSLYTDGELSIAVLDEDTNNPLAKKVRVDLWAEHLGIKQEDIDTALTLWPPNANQRIQNMPLPLIPSKKPFKKSYYDLFTDYDSRSKLW